MKVLLIDIDSSIPNLALAKCKAFHEQRGDTVSENFPLAASTADRIYVSCVFQKNRHEAEQYEVYPQALIGGSGYDLKSKLPPEIDVIKPRINMGFTTRGCIRKCGFCVVPEKEGNIRIVGDLLDLWDGKNKRVTIMDNNILAVPEHFKLICRQARDNNIRIDFNQGLDHRLLTPEIVQELAITPISAYRFAYDGLGMRKSVNRAVALLHAHGINYAQWYVLVGYNTSLREDVQRINHLRFLHQRAFVQRYKPEDRNYITIARWANHRQISNMTLMQFMKHEGKAAYFDEWMGLYLDKVGRDVMEGPKV